ncbi:MAG TPA: amidohydrolase family protein [Alphaproteobacteria bacterium]|nr:amidohydrolase family protein [Alphaproteobacteria bacterium]
MRILDTHLHLVYKDRFSYPWLDGVPALNRDWTVESYWAEAERLGIEQALHMEVDVAEKDMRAETEFVTALHPRVVGAIAAARPESRDFPVYLNHLAEIRGLKGIRRVLHVVPDEVSQADLFVENIQRLANYRLPFDMCYRADQLPLAKRLAAQCPDVQFVLDHCGVPNVEKQELDPWRGHITELAALPNVAAKISGIVAYAGPNWTVATLRPFVEHVIEAFGWDRVVWGSDHPVCTLTANLTRWVNATHELIAGASEEEKARLLHRNAERIYRI